MRARAGLFVACAVLLVLGVSRAALGGSVSPRVVWDADGALGCPGYVAQRIDGTGATCLASRNLGASGLSAAADGTVAVTLDGNIWVTRPDGRATEVDGSGNDYAPDISSDGSKITFDRVIEGTAPSEIYVVNVDGSGLVRVASGGTKMSLTDPVFSPDGKSIAYVCSAPPPIAGVPLTEPCGPLADGSYRTSGVMLMSADGSDKRMILIGGSGTGTAFPDSLSWSFSGEWITVAGLAGTECGSGGPDCRQQVFAFHSDGSDLFDAGEHDRQISHSTGEYGVDEGQFCGGGQLVLYFDAGNGDGSGSWELVNLAGATVGSVGLPPGVAVSCVPPGVGGGPPPLLDATRLKVPQLHALGLAAAKRKLRAANLSVGRVKHAYSSHVRKGRVVSQSPRAHAHAHRTEVDGPPVNLTVSRGKRPN